ncbi:hypothetical protein CCACVL1_16047, partial [Corchorus capsularis]
ARFLQDRDKKEIPELLQQIQPYPLAL